MDFKTKIMPPDGAVLLYGNFIDPKLVENKPYVNMNDMTAIQTVVEDFLAEYNANSAKTMSLVLFTNAIEHICRISRINNQPYGNALRVGVGGSGACAAPPVGDTLGKCIGARWRLPFVASA